MKIDIVQKNVTIRSLSSGKRIHNRPGVGGGGGRNCFCSDSSFRVRQEKKPDERRVESGADQREKGRNKGNLQRLRTEVVWWTLARFRFSRIRAMSVCRLLRASLYARGRLSSLLKREKPPFLFVAASSRGPRTT